MQPHEGSTDPSHTSPLQKPQRAGFHLFSWWYRFTTAPGLPKENNLYFHDLVRRTRLASGILFFLLLLTLLALPFVIITHNISLISIALVNLVINGLALLLNRKGKIGIVGILLVSWLELAYFVAFVADPNSLTLYHIPTFDLLIIPELVAVCLLPAASVFIVAGINCVFVGTSIAYQPHTTDLSHSFAASYYGIIAHTAVLQIIVAVITFLWVRGTMQTLTRADRSKEIALLQNEMKEQKQQLDNGMQQIQQALTHIANGHFNIRITMSSENVLWNISNALNTLFARFYALRKSQQELQQTDLEILRLTQAIHLARTGKPVTWPLPNKGHLDPLLRELRAAFDQSNASLETPPYSPRKEEKK